MLTSTQNLLGTLVVFVMLTCDEGMRNYSSMFFYAENGFFDGSTILQIFDSKYGHPPYLL